MSDFAEQSGSGSQAGDASTWSAELEQRIRELEQRLEQVGAGGGGGGGGAGAGAGGAGAETAYWAVLESVIPSEARRHLRAAGREQLLAARAMLDAWIARMDRQSDDRPSRHETITVE